MNEVDECWQFETGGKQYPDECVLVKFVYLPKRNGSDNHVYRGKCTVVASCLSIMWSPKDTAQLTACLLKCASLRW